MDEYTFYRFRDGPNVHMEDDERPRTKIRNSAWVLGLLVLAVYLGYMFLTALRGSGAVG